MVTDIITDTSDKAFTEAKEFSKEKKIYDTVNVINSHIRSATPKDVSYVNEQASRLLKEKIAKHKATYINRQIAINKQAMQDGGINHNVLGHRVGSIDPDMYYYWKRIDPTFWANKRNVNRFLQQNPEMKLKNYA